MYAISPFDALKGASSDVRYGAGRFTACGVLMGRAGREGARLRSRKAITGTAGKLVGHFYIHNGDDSALVANAAVSFNSLQHGHLTRMYGPAVRSKGFVDHVASAAPRGSTATDRIFGTAS